MPVLVSVGVRLAQYDNCFGGEGCGVVVSERHVLTAWHVVEDREESFVSSASTAGADDVKLSVIPVLKRTRVRDLDLAVLEVEPTWSEWANVAESHADQGRIVDVYGQGLGKMLDTLILFSGFIHARRRVLPPVSG